MRTLRATLRCAVALLLLFAGHAMAQQPPAQPGHHEHHEHERHSADRSSAARHVPPDPPQHPLPDQPHEAMTEMMQMDDRELYGRLVFEQLEWQDTSDEDLLAWDLDAVYGGDYHKLRLKSEGEAADGTQDARIEALWDRIISRWWSIQAGVRHDTGAGPSRTWASLGVEGLAPYWFDVEAALYVGEQGRTALRLDVRYELLLTQRLILEPQVEADLYGKQDRARGLGSGLAEIEAALRLRYEFRREFAPYVGFVWSRLFGATADFARAAGADPDDLQLVAGLRMWF